MCSQFKYICKSVSIPETQSDSGQRPVRSQWLGRNWLFPNWGGWPHQHTSSGMELLGYSLPHAIIWKLVKVLLYSCTETMLLFLKSFLLRDNGLSLWTGWKYKLSKELVFYLVEFLPMTEFIDGLLQDFKYRISVCLHHCIFFIPTNYWKWLDHDRNERVCNNYMCVTNQRCKSDI